MVVVSSGIEPESRASETLILSIVLRDLHASSDQSANIGGEDLDRNSK